MRYHWFLLAVLLLGGGRTEGQVTIEKLRQWTFTYGGRYDMPYGLFVSENNIYAYGDPDSPYIDTEIKIEQVKEGEKASIEAFENVKTKTRFEAKTITFF